MKLLDTSVAIDHLRGSPPAVDLLSGLVDAEESLFAGEKVRFELAGARGNEVEALEQFFSAVSWVPVLTTNVRHFRMMSGLRPAY